MCHLHTETCFKCCSRSPTDAGEETEEEPPDCRVNSIRLRHGPRLPQLKGSHHPRLGVCVCVCVWGESLVRENEDEAGHLKLKQYPFAIPKLLGP